MTLDLFTQTPAVFPSSAPINTKKFGGDNLKVFNALLSGRVINRTTPDMRNLTLHSRISDLRNKFMIPGIKDESMSIVIEEKRITVSKYWMEPEEINRVKQQFKILTSSF